MVFDTKILIILLVKVISFNCAVNLLTSDITTSQNDIFPLIVNLKPEVNVFIKEESIYSVDSSNVVKKIGENDIDTFFFSFSVLPLSQDKLLVFGGNNFLYFTDASFKTLQIAFTYDDVNADQSLIKSNSILEKSENKIFLIYLLEDKAYFKSYTINSDYNKLVLLTEFVMPFQCYSDSETHNFAGKFFEEGKTFIFCYIDENDQLNISIITEDDLSIENQMMLETFASEIKMVAFSENLMCLIYYDYNNIVTLSYFKIENRQFNNVVKKTFDWSNDIDLTNFIAEKIDDKTLAIAEVKSNEFDIHFISYFDEIKKNSITIPIQKVDQLRGSSFGKGIILVTKETTADKIQSTFITEFPQCRDLFFGLYSNEIKTISLSLLTENYKEVEIVQNELETKNGNSIITQNSEIQYSAGNNGNAFIYYSLKMKTNIIKSRKCQIVIKTCNDACGSCSEYSSDKEDPHCDSCSSGYHSVVDDASKCFNENQGMDGYFYDSLTSKFKKCHKSCLRCSDAGTDDAPNCISCPPDFQFDQNKKKCLCNTNKYPWYDNNGDPECVNDCPTQYPYIITETNECVTLCNKGKNTLIYQKTCVSTCPKGTTEKNGECKAESIKEVISNIDDNILDLSTEKPSGSFNTEKENSTYQIFETTEEGKAEAAKMKNVSTIDLGECETKLKEANGISQDEPLLIFKVDIAREGQLTNQVEYSVYDKNGVKLDLSVCENTTITVSSPVKIKDDGTSINLSNAKKLASYGYDIYNSSDPFYTDVCTPYTSDDNTDIPLEDRKKDMYTNVSFCENGCEYSGINLTSMKVDCKCGVKTTINQTDKGFSVNSLSNSFKTIISSSNLQVVKCHNLVFSLKYLKNNIGNWVIISLTILELILLVIYLFIGTKPVMAILNHLLLNFPTKVSSKNRIEQKPSNITDEQDISNRMLKKKRAKQSGKPEESNVSPSPPSRIHKRRRGNTSINNDNQDFEINVEPIDSNKKNYKAEVRANSKYFDDDDDDNNKAKVLTHKFRVRANAYLSVEEKEQKVTDYSLTEKENPERESQTHLHENEVITYSKSAYESKQSFDISDVNKKNFSFTDEELNDMKYKEAEMYDKRGFCRFYYSILKYDQLIIFTFFNNTDFNLKILKISMFLFGFAMFLTFNALFYTDSSMSHNYHQKGKFDFIYSLPKTLFSTIACAIINFLLKFLSLSQSDVKKIKEEKNLDMAKKHTQKFIKCLAVKIFFFFSLVIIFLFLFWYYDTAFCSVYKNTQKHLIIDTLTSFLLSMIYPFGICFATACVRILALRKKCSCLFCVSKVLQMF